jgi:type I restriction enzyme S subunit
MIDESAVSAAFNAAWNLSSAEAFATASTEVTTGLHRLEGAFYGSTGYRSARKLRSSGLTLLSVGQKADVQWFGPFTRTYVESPSCGVPFLSSSDMMEARIVPDRFLSKVLTRSLDRLLVQSGSVLVSRSGTVGNVAMVTADISNMAVSEHAIRVTTHRDQDDWRGLVYCLLQCELGQYLLTRNKSGSVIESLYADDVASLPLPRLPRAFRTELTRLIDDSCEMRVKANRRLDEAQEQVRRSCYLPDLKAFDPPQAFGDDSSAEMFVASSKAGLSPDRGFGELRLDATYHEPVALGISKRILASKGGIELGSLLLGVRNSSLRKRIYVEDAGQGVPLIGGKQLVQWRQLGLKYLSRALTKNLESEKVQNSWTIVSCGGTLGRCQFVHRNFEDCVMSQDVMRVIPDPSKVHPGFIYAFLSSPYGQAQIMQRGYGSVIPRLRDFQFRSIAIRVPDDKGEAVHETVVRAFDLRADARASEDRAINLFEEAIRRGRSYVEAEWGAEY